MSSTLPNFGLWIFEVKWRKKLALYGNINNFVDSFFDFQSPSIFKVNKDADELVFDILRNNFIHIKVVLQSQGGLIWNSSSSAFKKKFKSTEVKYGLDFKLDYEAGDLVIERMFKNSSESKSGKWWKGGSWL